MRRLVRDISKMLEEEAEESSLLQLWTTLKHMPMAAKPKFDALRDEMRNVLTEAQQVRALRYAEVALKKIAATHGSASWYEEVSTGELSLRLATLGLSPEVSMQSLWPVPWSCGVRSTPWSPTLP